MTPRLPRRIAPIRLLLLCTVAHGLLGGASLSRADATTSSAREVPLAELLQFAERNAPAVQLAVQRRGYGEAARTAATPWLRHNPTLQVGVGPRLESGSGPGVDFVASLGQPVEVAGERGLRLEAASRLGQRLDAETFATRWEVRREVRLAYQTAVIARERAALAAKLARFGEEMRAIAERRRAAGDATGVDVRIAETDLALARQAALVAEQELRTARLRLADVSGWPVEAPPNVPAGLGAPRAVPALDELLRAAEDKHPALRARQAATAEARARVELADREAWPVPSFVFDELSVVVAPEE